VITTDTDGSIVMLNKAAEEMTGWKSADAIGRPLQEVFVIRNGLTRELCENPVAHVLSTGAMVELVNHTCLITKDGREIQIADSGAPIRDAESRITGVVLVFRDMTEKQRLSDSMQRAQKLESLGILAGGIAHDFNNLLAGIFGYLDMALASVETNKTEHIQKYLNKAMGVYERAKGLTQQLLTFSKGGTPIRKTIPIAPLIQHSANFSISGSNVNCRFDFAEDLWLCDCDENQIGQVIDNIVINGKQAMPGGGKITITAVNVTDQPGHSGNYIRISIEDQGIGMPKDILPKIFDPFFSTKATGHGLGLATVYSIIQRHDGWIDVDSNPGEGSTFTLYLPASPKKELTPRPIDPVKHAGTGTVLVMDDEEFMLEIVDGMLREMGYTVVQAKNAKEAVGLFADAERMGNPFVTSILDLTIPGGPGGKEAAIALRKLNPNSIIIASSGYSEDPVISNPSEHGFTDRIIKPYRKNELAELMMRIM
jgi:PAS domain S-box-containing protein